MKQWKLMAALVLAGPILSACWIALAVLAGVDTWTRGYFAGAIAGVFATFASAVAVSMLRPAHPSPPNE